MACSCKNKGGASKKQVTSVKQVIKKPASVTPSSPQRKAITKRVILRRHI